MRVRGAALQGRVEALGCVSACLRANARARYLCVRARAGVGQGMSAHWASGSFSRRDHFTLPPRPPSRSPLFHLKRLVAADWALAGSAIGSGRVELFQPTSRPQNYCRTKEKREREGEREEEGDTGKKKVFVLFLFFSHHRLPLFLPGNMDQGPKSPALRLGRAGRVAPTPFLLLERVQSCESYPSGRDLLWMFLFKMLWKVLQSFL